MTIHKPVLLQQTIEALSLNPGMTVIDGTLGGGGYSKEIIEKISPLGRLIAVDVDQSAIKENESVLKKMADTKNIHLDLVNDNFRNLDDILQKIDVRQINAIVLDLGYSSDQMESSGRGFSFLRDEPLQMSLSNVPELSAIDIVNTASREELENILNEYGEESFAKEIAGGIVKAREVNLITKTSQLVEIIKQSTPGWYAHKKIHPATKTFQAIRIAVNDELGALRDFLSQVPGNVTKGARLAIVSFHSLEDRIVKLQFVAWERSGIARRINKKPIRPDREEIKQNPRSRSAKLRICEFI